MRFTLYTDDILTYVQRNINIGTLNNFLRDWSRMINTQFTYLSAAYVHRVCCGKFILYHSHNSLRVYGIKGI